MLFGFCGGNGKSVAPPVNPPPLEAPCVPEEEELVEEEDMFMPCMLFDGAVDVVAFDEEDGVAGVALLVEVDPHPVSAKVPISATAPAIFPYVCMVSLRSGARNIIVVSLRLLIYSYVFGNRFKSFLDSVGSNNL